MMPTENLKPNMVNLILDPKKGEILTDRYQKNTDRIREALSSDR